MVTQQTIQYFIDITQKTVLEDGLDSYLPTLLLPSRDHLMVLEGIPSDADHEKVARKWASGQVVAGESYLFAFRVDGAHFKVVSSIDGLLQEQTLLADAPNNSFKPNPLRGSA